MVTDSIPYPARRYGPNHAAVCELIATARTLTETDAARLAALWQAHERKEGFESVRRVLRVVGARLTSRNGWNANAQHDAARGLLDGHATMLARQAIMSAVAAQEYRDALVQDDYRLLAGPWLALMAERALIALAVEL